MNSESDVLKNKINELLDSFEKKDLEIVFEVIEMFRNNWIYDPWLKKVSLQDLIQELSSEIEEFNDAVNYDIEEATKEFGDILWDVFNLYYFFVKNHNLKFSEPLLHLLNKMKSRKPYIFEKRFVDLETAKNIWFNAKRNEQKNLKKFNNSELLNNHHLDEEH